MMSHTEVFFQEEFKIRNKEISNLLQRFRLAHISYHTAISKLQVFYLRPQEPDNFHRVIRDKVVKVITPAPR